MDYRNDIEITTVGELKKHIGEPLYFSYGSDIGYVAWIKEITHIDSDYDKQTIDGLKIYGKMHILLGKDGKMKTSSFLSSFLKEYFKNDSTTTRCCNAQRAIRTLTPKEKLEYKNTLRHYRIFGY